MDNSMRPMAETATAQRLGRLQGGDGGDKAEYATPDRSGLESGFYTEERGLPWHVTLARQLNTPELMMGVGGLLSGKDAQAAAGLDFEVLQVPISIAAGKDKGRHKIWKPVQGFVANVRSDTMEALGVVTPRFKLFQPSGLFAFGEAIVDAGGALWESGGSLYGGRWIFAAMELPDGIHVEGDPSDYRLFLVISTGFDGRHATEAFVTIERVICANTVKAGIRGAVSRFTIRHTSGSEGRIQEAREALGVSFKYAEQFAATAEDLIRKPLAERQVEEILRSLFPVPARDEGRDDRFPETTAGKVLQVYRESPSVDPIKGTAYGVFNAVTEYLDHGQEYRGRVGSSGDVKADSLIWGGPSEIKIQRTLDTLIKIAA